MGMGRIGRLGCLLLAASASVFPTTLEKLALDDMVLKSTEIVRGRVSNVSAIRRGALIVTQVKVTVSERWKGPEATTVELFLHGGTFQGLRQTFAGTPELRAGAEYVFFLWAGRSGQRQIIGLSQGVMDIQIPKAAGASGSPKLMAHRAALGNMVDPVTHEIVEDRGIELSLDQLRAQVKRTLSKASAATQERE